jgi:hypothetical protein
MADLDCVSASGEMLRSNRFSISGSMASDSFSLAVYFKLMYERGKEVTHSKTTEARNLAIEGSTWQKAYCITPSRQHSNHKAYILFTMNVAVWGRAALRHKRGVTNRGESNAR